MNLKFSSITFLQFEFEIGLRRRHFASAHQFSEKKADPFQPYRRCGVRFYSMYSTRTRRTALTREQALSVVNDIVSNRLTSFHLVPFKEFRSSHQGALMKSKQYEQYHVLCHENSKFHAGWFVCPFVLTHHCPVNKGVLPLDTKKGGTNRFGNHWRTHEKLPVKSEPVQQMLDGRCREVISRSAAMAVILDLRPLSFAEEHEGIATFAESVFKAGQTIPYGVSVNRKSYLPTRTAVNTALTNLVKKWREKFSVHLKSSLMSLGGAVSVDSVTLKIQNRHFLDFTVHHLTIAEGRTVLERPSFTIKDSTILFLESPDVASGQNMRSCIDENLRAYYGVDFNSMQKQFTIVTDGAAAMARMANSSVSLRIAPRDQKWMRCYVHVLQKSMQSVFESCSDDPLLNKISSDFKFVKRIVEDSKRFGWNKDLPSGYRLIQDVETRFGTVFLVCDRFLKSASKVWGVILRHNRDIARESYEALEKIDDSTGAIAGFPCLQAVVDAFKPVQECIVDFQASNVPTLHKILPSLQFCMTELSQIESGSLVASDEGILYRPSVYSMRLSGLMKLELQRIEVHDLWLVSCYLHPFLRDMEFWNDPSQREQFKVRGEKLLRTMCSDLKSASSRESEHGVEIHSIQPNGEGSAVTDYEELQRPFKRAKFSLKNHVVVKGQATRNSDEVTRYKSTELSQFGLDPETFLSNPFSVLHFWHSRKSMYPSIFKIAVRVFATPASSCSSERVFSIMKKLVTPDRATISTEHISQIIIGRSLSAYK